MSDNALLSDIEAGISEVAELKPLDVAAEEFKLSYIKEVGNKWLE